MWTLLFFTLTAFTAAMIFMGVGLIFSNKCMHGSCGGEEVLDPDGNPLSCETCPNRDDYEEVNQSSPNPIPNDFEYVLDEVKRENDKNLSSGSN